MRNFKKLCAVVLALMLILTSMSGVFGVLVSAEEATETETVTITESPRELLKEQMRAIYTAAKEADSSITRDSALNKVVSILQTGPWYVYGTTAKANSWSNTKGYWRRYDSSSTLDLRYGHSDWSYTTASIRVSYKAESASNGEALTALLRPDSSSTDSRKNAYIGLYYVAETSGKYYISDNFGGFIVRKTAASGYNAYVTILANGKEIYKSIPISRSNRIARFEGATVELQAGDKIEYRFTYEGVADKYSGDIEFDFDPQITLLSQTEDIVLEGDGEVAQVLYEALDLLEASGTNKSVTVAQTAVWRAQMYSSSTWKDLTYYCTHSKQYNGNLDWGYNESSHSQTDRISIKYKDSTVSKGLFMRSTIPMTRWNMKQSRLAYTAEYDGNYTLTDKFGKFIVASAFTAKTALVKFDFWIQITHNGTVLWKSDILANDGETADFSGITVDMKKGDTLAIEFRYSRKSGTEGYDATAVTVDFAPILTYTPYAKDTVIEYPAIDAYDALFEDIAFEEDTVETSGTLTQPDYGWVFKYGMSADSLTKISKFLKRDNLNGEDKEWVHNYLFNKSASTANDPAIARGTGSLSTHYNKLGVNLRSRMENDGSGIRSGVYAYEYAYSFIAPYDGKYVLSQADLKLVKDSTIPGLKIKIYKSGNLLYASDMLCNDNKTVIIPENTFVLSRGEELIIFFERQDSPEDKNFNNWMYMQYTPTITYYDMSVVVEDKEAYAPVKTERYYAENVTAPVSVSAFVKTEDILSGAIVSSDEFTLDIANKGYPRVTFADNEIVFPVDVRSESFNHIAVVYNSEAGEWYLYLNGVKVSTVAGAGISADVISKLYVGASADVYNNSYFKGSIAELALFSTALTDDEVAEILESGVLDAQNYWALSNVADDLICEEISVPDYDKDDNGIAYTNHNKRLDLYEEFEVPVNTFEAWIRLDTAFADGVDAGIITSSAQINRITSYGSAPCVILKITANGKPTLVIVDSTTTTITFNADVRSDDYIHLAVTADYDAGYYYCYINGQLVDKQLANVQIPVVIRPYVVSGNYFNQDKPYFFQGDIAGVSMFSDARTQNEILDDIYGVDLTDTDLLGSWYIDDALEDMPNRNGDGNDLHAFWATSADEVVDESFGNYSTFVFIPDTQYFNQSQGDEGMATISNWILENKESENIVGVMGLGDITNDNSTTQWQNAATAYSSLKGAVPYVFVAGNHDYGTGITNEDGTISRNSANYNTYFPYDDWAPYMSGFYEEGKIDNMYYLLDDVNGEKYMMLGLEFQPRDAVLEWASELVEEYSDYKVIVTTHGYQNYNHTNNENVYISSNSYQSQFGTDTNVGSEMWDKFVSRHENIQAVVCGHVNQEDVHYTTNTGVNGNSVVEIIANAQYTDTLMRMSGTILIMRISEDGTKANLNYYSPFHNHYNKDINQFTIDWHEAVPAAKIGDTEYNIFNDALENIAEGDTLTLLKNVKISDTVTFSKNVVIDTAGFTITNLSGTAVFKTVDGKGVSFVNGIYTVDIDSLIADINKSGKVDSDDLIYVRKVLLGKSEDFAVYDINGDGAIDIRDLIRIKKLAGVA